MHRRRGDVESLVGREVTGADAHGKHLFLRLEGGLVVHAHQGMNGGWQVLARGQAWRRSERNAWLIVGSERARAAQFGGPQVVLRREAEMRNDPRLRALGPDLLADGFTTEAGVAALRTRALPDATLGEALLNQNVIAGIGNIFKSEGCWAARIDPWRRLADLSDEEAGAVVEATTSLMRSAVESGRQPKKIYRRVGEPCPRCQERIRSRGQGDANRTTYWCPSCQ
jgi:endonuclease-8